MRTGVNITITVYGIGLASWNHHLEWCWCSIKRDGRDGRYSHDSTGDEFNGNDLICSSSPSISSKCKTIHRGLQQLLINLLLFHFLLVMPQRNLIFSHLLVRHLFSAQESYSTLMMQRPFSLPNVNLFMGSTNNQSNPFICFLFRYFDKRFVWYLFIHYGWMVL